MICNMLFYFEFLEFILEVRIKLEMIDFLFVKKGLILKLIKLVEICMIIVYDCVCVLYGIYC